MQRLMASDVMAERRAQNPFAREEMPRSSSVPPRAQTPRSTSSRSSRSSSTPRRRASRNEFAGMTKLEVMAERRRRATAAQRYGPTPGPGSYSPQQVETTSRSFAGSAAFRSTSDMSSRSASCLHEMGDPGEYTVSNKTLANMSKTSFSASERAGKYGFSSLTKRFNFVIRDGPGPIYDTRPDWLDVEARRGRKSSGFLTAVQRSAWLNKGFHVDNKYDTESSYKFLEKRATGGDSIFRNEVQRFRTTFTISPGPAAHVPNNHTLARMLIERKRDARMSTSTREDLFRPPRVRTTVRV